MFLFDLVPITGVVPVTGLAIWAFDGETSERSAVPYIAYELTAGWADKTAVRIKTFAFVHYIL